MSTGAPAAHEGAPGAAAPGTRGAAPRPLPFRQRLRAWHRDVGYLVAGLTLAYSVSGVAVNHIDVWNPKYAIEVVDVDLGPLPRGDLQAGEAAIVAGLGIDPVDVRGRFAPSADDLVVFLPEGGEVRVALASGRGRHKRVTPRPLLYDAHLLHLNALKGAWTYVADAFAMLLAFLALSGLWLPRGRQGLVGRGGVLLVVGLIVPVAALVALAP